MKTIEVETPEKGEAWVERHVDGYLCIVVDPSLANIQYTDRDEVTVKTRR